MLSPGGASVTAAAYVPLRRKVRRGNIGWDEEEGQEEEKHKEK